MFITKTKDRNLTIHFDEGNFLLEEVVNEERKTRTDTVWLTCEEIEKLHNFKIKMTGERS